MGEHGVSDGVRGVADVMTAAQPSHGPPHEQFRKRSKCVSASARRRGCTRRSNSANIGSNAELVRGLLPPNIPSINIIEINMGAKHQANGGQPVLQPDLTSQVQVKCRVTSIWNPRWDCSCCD